MQKISLRTDERTESKFRAALEMFDYNYHIFLIGPNQKYTSNFIYLLFQCIAMKKRSVICTDLLWFITVTKTKAWTDTWNGRVFCRKRDLILTIDRVKLELLYFQKSIDDWQIRVNALVKMMFARKMVFSSFGSYACCWWEGVLNKMVTIINDHHHYCHHHHHHGDDENMNLWADRSESSLAIGSRPLCIRNLLLSPTFQYSSSSSWRWWWWW